MANRMSDGVADERAPACLGFNGSWPPRPVPAEEFTQPDQVQRPKTAAGRLH